MLRDLRRYLAHNQLVEIIYLDRNGRTSKRVLRLHSIDGEKMKAYCFTRQANRVFIISNILAAVPVAVDHAV
ncbi:WYL domain-containing protein [Brevibacillus humidisoli]|uniref:WYL domain-containing protein n=1 Tax=Brevibacillus humidisoli TaxID=2895522 RepID=UPI001E38E1AB|nr:WYL domain-containing protein [Brevibacillus humidisoli]UFJ42046.1 WYL domain-containing protein [Brevibacillus humidisoli]